MLGQIKYVSLFFVFRALGMLIFMVILQERMDIKHFPNVFDRKILFFWQSIF